AAESASAGTAPACLGVVDSVARSRHAVGMSAHGALGLVVMAGLLLVMGGAGFSAVVPAAMSATATLGADHHGGAASGASGALVAFVGVGTLAYALFSGVLAWRVLRSPRPRRLRMLGAVEVVCMGASALLMLVATL
ncbi:MAG: hypothetical protein Q7T71_11005, partial [Herbiconiux sp.]|nr:hypothetical protein [Herbiconiux sp.]